MPDDHSECEPPDPISNSEVKVLSADGSVGSPHVRVVYGGVGIGSLMISASLALYAFPDLMKPEEQLAQEQSIIQLQECNEVFQAIGIMLSEGQIPDNSMSCPGTNVPNIVSRQGNRITVSHPNPRQFGLTELYVTNDSHRVVMKGQGQG